MTGPPGAGKSTIAALLVQRWSPSALVAGDEFFGFLRGGYVEPWLPESHAQNETVVEAAAAATGRLARGGLTVVYDGVVGPWFAPTFLAATGAPSLHYVVVLPPEDVCLDRVRTRSGHGFTDLDAARQLYGEFRDAPLAERHVVRPAPHDDASAVADTVETLVRSGTALATP